MYFFCVSCVAAFNACIQESFERTQRRRAVLHSLVFHQNSGGEIYGHLYAMQSTLRLKQPHFHPQRAVTH